jgi:hypothetical protein
MNDETKQHNNPSGDEDSTIMIEAEGGAIDESGATDALQNAMRRAEGEDDDTPPSLIEDTTDKTNAIRDTND